MKRQPKRRIGLRLVAMLAAVALADRPARAADPALGELAGLSLGAMFLNSGAPGMIVAMVRGTESRVLGFGETAKGNGQEPTRRSVFRIGSISKALTGELLAELVADGTVRLGDPLQRFAPPGRLAGDHAHAEIAALPKLLARVRQRATRRPRNNAKFQLLICPQLSDT